jgi:nicotinamidase-related amidase
MPRVRKKYTLVVIDIQPKFKESADYVLEPVKQEMLLAMDRKMPILLVEYAGHGETMLKPVVARYPKCYVATKSSDGGAYEVSKALRSHNLPRSWLRVCGVNTDCCVYRTVCALDNPLIEVVEKACFSNWAGCGNPANHNSGIRKLAELKNVVIDPHPPIKVA